MPVKRTHDLIFTDSSFERLLFTSHTSASPFIHLRTQTVNTTINVYYVT